VLRPHSSQLRSFLKRFFLHSICLARARTSEPAAVRDQVFDKKVESRKRVATRTNLSKAWPQTWFSTRFAVRFSTSSAGLQLARIIECGLYCVASHVNLWADCVAWVVYVRILHNDFTYLLTYFIHGFVVHWRQLCLTSYQLSVWYAPYKIICRRAYNVNT